MHVTLCAPQLLQGWSQLWPRRWWSSHRLVSDEPSNRPIMHAHSGHEHKRKGVRNLTTHCVGYNGATRLAACLKPYFRPTSRVITALPCRPHHSALDRETAEDAIRGCYDAVVVTTDTNLDLGTPAIVVTFRVRNAKCTIHAADAAAERTPCQQTA